MPARIWWRKGSEACGGMDALVAGPHLLVALRPIHVAVL